MLLMKYFACSLAQCWRSYSFGQDSVIRLMDKSHSIQGYSGNVVEGRRFLVKEDIFGRT